MWKIVRHHPFALFAALLAHGVVFLLLFVGFKYSDHTPELNSGGKEKIEIIKATAVDEREIQAELKRLKNADRRKKNAVRKLEQKRRQEQRRLTELKKKRQVEEKKRKQQKVLEEKRLAELAKKRKAIELEKQEEEKRLAKLEQQRHKEEDIARQAEMKKQLEAEIAGRKAAASAKARASEIDRYAAMIKRSAYRAWMVPTNAKNGMVSVFKVRLIPSGDVLTVTQLQSSGNRAFDQSVEKAIYRAAPYPVPPAESGLFNELRELKLVFKPDGVK